MLDRVVLYNFKGFQQVSVPIRDGVSLLVGPNNIGKSSVLQGVLLALECFRQLFEDNRLKFDAAGVLDTDASVHGGKTVADFIFFQLAKSTDLWLVGTNVVSGNYAALVFPGDAYVMLNFGMSVNLFRFKVSRVNGNITRQQIADLVARPAVLIPSFAGIASEEERKTNKRVRSLISKGHFNEVVRNILFDLKTQSEPRFNLLKQRLRNYFQIEDLSVEFNPAQDEFVQASYKVTQGTKSWWLDISTLGLGTLQMLQMLALAMQENPWLILLDEPDSHMHASLQSKVIDLLQELSRDSDIAILAATHSKDMMNRVELDNILRVERDSISPIASTDEQRDLLLELGLDNFDLANMLQDTRLVVVEGPTDVKMLTSLCKKFGINNLPNFRRIQFYKAGSRGQVLRFDPSPLTAFLGNAPRVMAIYDKDYFHPERHEEDGRGLRQRGVATFPLSKKEFENYVLLPALIADAANAVHPGFGITADQVSQWLEEAAETQRDTVLRELGVHYSTNPPESLKVTAELPPQALQAKQMSDGIGAAQVDLTSAWQTQTGRLSLVCGKDAFSYVKAKLTALKHRGINFDRVAEQLTEADLPPDLAAILETMRAFAQ